MSAQLFIEIQCEELPARYVVPACEGLRDAVLGILEGFEHGKVRTYASPRHVAVVVDAVAGQQATRETVVTGPPAERGFVDGQWTKAALGFARGKGATEADLSIVDGPRGPVVAVKVTEGGEKLVDVIGAQLADAILGLSFAKSMEWGSGGVRWARPLQRVSVLFDGQVIPGEVAGVSFSNTTIGHRLADDTEFSFTDEASWLKGLRARMVEPDLAKREAHILALLDEAAERLGSDPIRDEELLDEVRNLVEAPALVLGQFDEDLLHLPPRLLIKTMKHHQRYFPVHKNGSLTHHFVVISNNPLADEAHVAAGNAMVLRARFYDARFFFAEDQKKSLEAFGSELGKMRWVRGLGTMAEKQARVSALAEALAPMVGADAAHAARAGALCKCDLTTAMVFEFPELQGHMGRLYAAAAGEPTLVAQAIEEHYQPRFAGDATPASSEGAAVAIADRLDSLVGCFAVGMRPKGGDPQGLRRAALGVVVTLLDRGLELDLRDLVSQAVQSFHKAAVGADGFQAWAKHRGEGEVATDSDALVDEIVTFMLARYRAHAQDAGASADLVDAVMDASPAVPVVLEAKLAAIRAAAGTAEFKPIMETFKRVLNISRGQDYPAPEREAYTEPVELALHDALVAAEQHAASAGLDYEAVLAAMLGLAKPVSNFFDGPNSVMANAEDPAVRAVRIGLLLRISRLFLTLADFSKISTR